MKDINSIISRITIVVVCLVMSLSVFGQNKVDLGLATRVGENFIKMNDGVALSGEAGSLQRVQTDKFPNLYIFNADEHGFIIVASDKRSQPVLAFSDEGTFDPNDMAPAAEMIIGGYDYVVDSLVRYNARATDESVAQAWRDLERGYYERNDEENRDVTQPQYPRVVSPLIKTHWHQGSSKPYEWQNNYNQFCPFTKDDNNNPIKRAYTGCVATAMGQLLYYYKYKPNMPIIKERPFYHKPNEQALYMNAIIDDEGNVGLVESDEFTTNICNQGLENISLYTYTIGNWDFTQSTNKQLAARIMRDCGIVVDCRYGLNTSSAYDFRHCDNITSALFAFKEVFGFHNTIHAVIEKEIIGWNQLHIRNHLAKSIPIYCYGKGKNNEKHAYLIDGYYTADNDQVFFHYNYGDGDDISNNYYTFIYNPKFTNQGYIILTPNSGDDYYDERSINWGLGYEYPCPSNNKIYRIRKGNNMSVSNTSSLYEIVYNTPGEYIMYDYDNIDNKNILIKITILPDLPNNNSCSFSAIVCRKKMFSREYEDNGRVYFFRIPSNSTDYDGSRHFVSYYYDSISGAITGKCTLTLTTKECNNSSPNVSCLNNGISGSKDGQPTNQIIYNSVTKYHEYVSAMDDLISRVLMEAYWRDEEKGIEFWNLFQSLLDNNTGIISEEGIQQLINQSQLENISDDYIRFIAETYNQSILYWNEGYYTNDSLPDGYGGMIEYDTAAMRKAYDAQAYAESLGFNDVREMYDNAYEMLETEIENNQTSVCARVTVQFNQKMTMTREAFNGTLQIFNGHESIPMEDIFVDFRIEDQQGNDCTNLFQINTLSLDQITGISGDGSLAAQTNGTALVQFIPTKNAAPIEPKVYSFGGSFSFIDPFTGEGLTYPLYPVEITVNPSPDLYVDYFMQRDILGDDALTEDIVEPSVPAELGVIIHNQGAGEAKNVTLETAEPQIIDNEHGLAIDFAMYGASFNGSPRQLGLTEIRFGNIESGQTAVGEWLFTSSLLGHFVSYEAHVIHNSSYGNSDLSLVSHLDIHELIHPIYAYGSLDDGINDFLVNDNPDAYDTPDSIYFSHGGKTSVGVVDDISFDHLVSPSDTIVTLTVEPSRVGWNYGVTDDPGMNQYNIVSCIRNNDNQEIPLNNVWLTFVTIPDGGDPVYENKLHIVDTIPAQQTTTYTLVFEYNPDASYSMAQNMSLSQGWNWWSTYIEQSNIDGLSMLENSLGHKGVTIKSQFDFVQNFYSDYGEDVWFGSLEGLANEQGYMIDVTEDCSVSMAGVRAKPVSHPITINPNWNWIGYPVTSRQSVTSALADYNALPEDLIKNQYEFSIYYDGFGWFPDDLVMNPGEGYFYYSNAPTSQTLTYSTSRGEVLPEKSDKREWKTNVHAFADNISIVAVVSIDSIEQRDEELELGAFVNGECRGSARLKHFGPLDRYYAVLSVAGQEGDKVEFGFINKEKGQGSMSCENHVAFVRNDVVGSLDTPYVVRFNTQTEADQNGFMVLFPNPVEHGKTFSLEIPKDEMLMEVVIVDMLGEEILRKTGALKPNEIEGLPVVGIYIVKATTQSGKVYFGRLVVK